MPAADDVFDVLCYGTIRLDNTTYLPYAPTPQYDASALYEYDEMGGEAIKVAIPLATWGLRVLVAGNLIGTDRKATFIMDELKRYPAIDTRYIRQHPNVSTPFSRIFVTPDGERRRILYGYNEIPKVEVTESMMRQARILSVDAYGRYERGRAAAVAHA